MIIVLAQLLAIFSFAAGDGAFVSSPTGSAAPELVDVVVAEGCNSEIKITAYRDRSELDPDFAAVMESAYNTLLGTEDLGAIGTAVTDAATKYGVESGELLASELFAVYSVNCESHEGHVAKVTIKPAVVDNFVGLLRYDGSEWSIVEAELNDGKLTFDFTTDAVYSVLLTEVDEGPSKVEIVRNAITGAMIGGVGLFFLIFLLMKKQKER